MNLKFFYLQIQLKLKCFDQISDFYMNTCINLESLSNEYYWFKKQIKYSCLFMTLFEMFHEYSNDDVNKNELCHQHENYKKYRSYNGAHATILHAVRCFVAIVSQSVLHDTVPIVAGGHSKKRQKRHTKITKMGMLSETLARHIITTFCNNK